MSDLQFVKGMWVQLKDGKGDTIGQVVKVHWHYDYGSGYYNYEVSFSDGTFGTFEFYELEPYHFTELGPDSFMREGGYVLNHCWNGLLYAFYKSQEKIEELTRELESLKDRVEFHFDGH